MKYLAFFAFSVFSLSSYSQSFLIMDNGITITTDNKGVAYDFGHYAFPQKVTLKGGRFYVEDNSVLATIDDNGLLFKKYEAIPKDIKGKGNNYFISDEKVYGIDSRGVLKVSEDGSFKKAKIFGGNFFITQTGLFPELNMYVVNLEGTPVKVETGEINLKEIVEVGGSYFMNRNGELYTISGNGLLTLQDDFRIGMLAKKGGNFFVDSSNYLFTIDQNGGLHMPSIPLDLDVSNILKAGTNYFIDMEGRFYVVDKDGNIFERVMPDHDFRMAKVISI